MNLFDGILSIHHQGSLAWHAQGGMQYGTMFGRVDLFPGKHRIAFFFDLAFPCELQQQTHGVGVDSILRVIQEQAGRFYRESLETP